MSVYFVKRNSYQIEVFLAVKDQEIIDGRFLVASFLDKEGEKAFELFARNCKDTLFDISTGQILDYSSTKDKDDAQSPASESDDLSTCSCRYSLERCNYPNCGFPPKEDKRHIRFDDDGNPIPWAQGA